MLVQKNKYKTPLYQVKAMSGPVICPVLPDGINNKDTHAELDFQYQSQLLEMSKRVCLTVLYSGVYYKHGL